MKYHKNNDHDVVFPLYFSISALTAVKMKLYTGMQMLASSQQVGLLFQVTILSFSTKETMKKG